MMLPSRQYIVVRHILAWFTRIRRKPAIHNQAVKINADNPIQRLMSRFEVIAPRVPVQFSISLSISKSCFVDKFSTALWSASPVKKNETREIKINIPAKVSINPVINCTLSRL